MERINRGRKRVKSQSVDNAKYKKSEEIQRKADNLAKRLFKNQKRYIRIEYFLLSMDI